MAGYIQLTIPSRSFTPERPVSESATLPTPSHCRSTSCASTRSARSPWTRCRRRTRDTQVRRWRSRRSRTCCSRGTCGTIRRTRLAEPRSLRALLRPRVDAAVQRALSDRLRSRRSRISSSSASGRAGRPGTRSTATRRRRDDDRSARPGHRQRRRHGDGRGAPRRRVQSRGARRSSITTRTSSAATAT